MTSQRRSIIVISLLTIGAVCTYGQGVDAWTLQDVFGIVGVGAAAAVAGMTKSPREGALSDAADGQIVTSKSTTTIETDKEIQRETTQNPGAAGSGAPSQ